MALHVGPVLWLSHKCGGQRSTSRIQPRRVGADNWCSMPRATARDMPRSSEILVLLDSIPGEFAAYAFSNVLIACWPKRSQVPGVTMLADIRSQYLANHPEGASLIHLSGDASLPDAETSEAWVDMMKRYSDRLRCIGVVSLERGFGASALRSWVTDKRMLQAPGEFKMRFDSSADGLLEWLPDEHERRTGVRLNRALLMRHLRWLIDECVLAHAPSQASRD